MPDNEELRRERASVSESERSLLYWGRWRNGFWGWIFYVIFVTSLAVAVILLNRSIMGFIFLAAAVLVVTVSALRSR